MVTYFAVLGSSTLAVPISRDRRETDFNFPCIQNASLGSGPRPLPHVSVKVMRDRTNGVRLMAIETQNQAVSMGLDVSYWRQVTSLVEEALGDVHAEKTKFLNITTRADVLKRHLTHVYNITKMLNYARNAGEIGKATSGDGSLESVLRKKMNNVEAEIDSLVCDQFLGLKSVNVTETPVIPDYTPIDAFYPHERNFEDEVERAYVLMRDIEKVMVHLNTVYAYAVDDL